MGWEKEINTKGVRYSASSNNTAHIILKIAEPDKKINKILTMKPGSTG